MSVLKSLPGGTGRPQWKQLGESAGLAGSVWVAEMDMVVSSGLIQAGSFYNDSSGGAFCANGSREQAPALKPIRHK
jgi:hypothetical protein